MSNTTRKRIWPAGLVMALAIVGLLAAFVAVGVSPGVTEAQTDDPPAPSFPAPDPTDDPTEPTTPTDTPTETPTPEANIHATMPEDFWLEGLDNGARLSWEAPTTVATHATIYGYQIKRDAWNQLDSHPINMYGDATIKVYAHQTDLSDLGLAYETVYTYMVRAVVQYNVEGWWNMLDCVDMNDAVDPEDDEPAVGADVDGTTYCKMYDDLSAEAMVVVQRAYAALDASEYTYYGEWSYKRSLETADSGGRLEALLEAPSMPRNLTAVPACATMISVSWQAPTDFGTVPSQNADGVYVGPDYIGGTVAGLEEVGEDATSVTYEVQRSANSGVWASVTAVGRTYTDTSVAYENSYAYRVRAVNGVGLRSAWVMVTERLTEPDEPQMPSSLNVDTVGGTVELQWDAPVDEAGLWRTQMDFDRTGDASATLQYVVDRKVGSGSWVNISTQYHLYADNYIDTLTQAFTDKNPPVGAVSYRVAALVHGCNPSAYNQKDPVDIVAQPLGSATGLSGAAGAATGTVELSWTAGTSSTRHWLAGVKVSDWTAMDFSNVIFRATANNDSDTVSGLDSGEAYAFTVLSGDEDGWDDTWAEIQRVTPN